MNWMNRLLSRHLFLLLFLLGPILALAQPKLKIASVYSLPADTVIYPNTDFISYYVVVENVGNNQLTGPCSIRFRYNTDTTQYVKKEWSVSNFEVGQTDTLEYFNDTIFTLGTGRYDGGVNIIVIWPQSDNPGVLAPDTTHFPIYIQNINAIADPTVLAQRVEVYPNPVGDELNFRYLQTRHKVEYVRMLDVEGRIVRDELGAAEHIDTGSLPQGMYFVMIKFKDGMVGSLRIVKPE